MKKWLILEADDCQHFPTQSKKQETKSAWQNRALKLTAIFFLYDYMVGK